MSTSELVRPPAPVEDHFQFGDTNAILWDGINLRRIKVWLCGTWSIELLGDTLLLSRLEEELKLPLGHLLVWKPNSEFEVVHPSDFIHST